MSGAAAANPPPPAHAIIKSMPARGHSTAPTFDGDALNLIHFFNEVDVLGTEAGLTDEAKIRQSLRYARREEFELWTTLREATGVNFTAFRAAVTKLYPGADDQRRYSEADLRRLVTTQQAYGIMSRDELGSYYREFRRIATFLIDRARISELERNKLYVQGFDGQLQDRILGRLQYLDPTHYPDDPYDWERVNDCAYFLLAGTPAGTGGTVAPRSSAAAATAARPTPAAPIAPARIKEEPGFEAALQDLETRMEKSFAAAFSRYAAPPQQYYAPPQQQGYAPRPNYAPQQPPTARPDYAQQQTYAGQQQQYGGPSTGAPPRCYFDGCPARIRECSAANEYLAKGLCSRNDVGRIVLPSGMSIPAWCTGATLKDRIDNWHHTSASAGFPGPRPPTDAPATPIARDAPPHLPVASSHMIEVVESLHSAVSGEDGEPDDELYEVLQNALQKHQQKKVRFDGVEVPPRTFGKKPQPPKPIPASTTANRDIGARPSILKGTPPAPPVSAPKDGPQYKYASPLEDAAVISTVVNRALETTVSLSHKELLAISPDIRKQYKELTTTKRVAAGLETHALERPVAVSQYEQVNNNSGHFEYTKRDSSGDLIVGEDSMPLRAVWPTIEGKVTCECLLDNGSQMVTMNEKIWKKLGNNLRIQECVEMQAANSSRTITNGRLRDVKFTFGDIDVYLQVQVMSNVPYDVLLGRPFTALTECVTRDYRNGDQHITIRDPNSDTVVTLPTRERNYPRSVKSDF